MSIRFGGLSAKHFMTADRRMPLLEPSPLWLTSADGARYYYKYERARSSTEGTGVADHFIKRERGRRGNPLPGTKRKGLYPMGFNYLRKLPTPAEIRAMYP
ncbi:hypothetical protein, partial [uncultured Gemmiger sp.]|uniref:hypothetical protein n=1 Tax=uncultured Gemmiger sp. TaxID=1623490 RepID=UPI0025EC9240